MPSSEQIHPKNAGSDFGNLADFLTPFEHSQNAVSPSEESPVFPAVFYLHEKITDSVKQVHLALARFNASGHGPTVFRQDGHLVRVVQNEDGSYAVVPLDRNRLRLILSEAGTWKRFLKDVIVEPHNALLDAAIAAPSERYRLIPVLAGLHSGVLLRADGTIACTAGFDAASGFFLTATHTLPPVPEHPSESDVGFVREMLADIFGEFLFAGPADAANAVAALMTAVLRPTMQGPVPIWAIDKNTPRAGGSLLALAVGALAYGEVPIVHATSRRRDEMEKIVRMTVRENLGYVVLDNVVAGTDWTPEVLLSATSGSGRVMSRNMGTYSSFTGKTPAFFVVNGVHLNIRADVTGRMFLVRLAAPKAWQEIRFSRTKTELLELASAMHPQAVWGVAVLLRFWQQAGEPAFRLVSGNLSEFPEWLRVVGGALAHAGWSAVLANQGEMQSEENEADVEGAELVAALYAVFGERAFSAKALLKILVAEGAARKSGTGHEGLLNYADEAMIRSAVSGTLSSVKVGMWLKEYVGTRFAGAEWYVERSDVRIENVRQYHLVPVESQTVLC
ncbi:hypothetical protein [Methanorbis furvi]|uniref:Uncharacterized protein n=1 Tax=Methanorbis furvi TaxID=3028299 RepID=A0AAE4MCD4_9EURY|nr:hypothetical protein [Methanocorpusculaceae archaeon Ag1]